MAPEIFAYIAIAVAVLRYTSYLWSIYKRETRPHAFSWLIWSIIVGIGAFAQMQLGGGPSSWVLIVVSATCLFIGILAIFIGEKNITKGDWGTFVSALIVIPIWQATNSPLLALVLLMVIDLLSFYPSVRKTWIDPTSEPPASMFLSGLRYFLALFAVPEPQFSTMVYPVFLMLTDWLFCILIITRRHIKGVPLWTVIKENKKPAS